jgi:hypothetical protein
MKKVDMINKKYGMLLVISEHSKTRNGHTKYECLCDCGKKANILGTHLRQGNSKSCGCNVPRIGPRHSDWNGVGKISGAYWANHVVKSANGSKGRRKIELTITKEYAWKLFVKQNEKCSLTGLNLRFPEKHNDKSWTASLDRIDSSKGYIEGNVQWVHKDVNMMKRIYSQEYFIYICKLIANNTTIHAGGCEVISA